MKKLGLPCPQYECELVTEDNFTTKVLFYPSMEFLRASSHPYLLYGYPAMTVESSTYNAARQAIQYMEKVEKKVPASFNEIAFEKQVRSLELIRDQLQEKNGRLNRASNQLADIAATCDTYIDTVTDSFRCIKRIIMDGLAQDAELGSDVHRARLLQIQNVAVSLSKYTAHTVASLKAAGK